MKILPLGEANKQPRRNRAGSVFNIRERAKNCNESMAIFIQLLVIPDTCVNRKKMRLKNIIHKVVFSAMLNGKIKVGSE